MAEIALVIDINGVWSKRDTLRMTPNPMKDASTKTYSVGQKSTSSLSLKLLSRCQTPAFCSASRVRVCFTSPLCVMIAPR